MASIAYLLRGVYFINTSINEISGMKKFYRRYSFIKRISASLGTFSCLLMIKKNSKQDRFLTYHPIFLQAVFITRCPTLSDSWLARTKRGEYQNKCSSRVYSKYADTGTEIDKQMFMTSKSTDVYKKEIKTIILRRYNFDFIIYS